MEAIRATDVSIRYIVGDFKDIGLKEYVLRKLTGNYSVTEFWANRNISFSLERGDMLGVIGANGAGKSTLLKAVSGILAPTKGSIAVEGRVAALLELGSGFDGDMTVRENTFLRGAMLGYTRPFMEEKYDEIIRFAELEDFQERCFKHLSSGMKSRLAFSIACLVEPEILILDEVLSVGDGAFRRKSSERMREILGHGVTGLLVSHSIGQVRELCNKILWLDHGRQVCFSEDVETCCNAYEEFLRGAPLPEGPEDIAVLSEAWQRRMEKAKLREKQKQVRQVKKTLSGKQAKKYIDDAVAIVRKYRPELLVPTAEDEAVAPEDPTIDNNAEETIDPADLALMDVAFDQTEE